MKKLKNYIYIFAMLAMAGLMASCSGDSDELPSAVAQQVREQMRGNYTGDLTYGTADNPAQNIAEGVGAVSADSLTIALPLDAVAEQMGDADIVNSLRSIGTIKVRAAYKFLKDRQGGIKYRLVPTLAERIEVPQHDIKFAFSNNYIGEYYDNSIECRIGVERVSIDGKAAQGFRAVVYRYKSNPRR